ncbi:MAG TPA: GNAT family N-acetyltransferase [Tepidisphaeraceae bacterium]|nr:GNAT family N-acetyltransferase [Tepidisphaeraceae bacterium]
MFFDARPTSLEQILPWRDLYRHEMNCQIIHDSLHERDGWTQSYSLTVDGTAAGYGAIAIGGPWKGKPTAFEFYVLPQFRNRTFDLFEAFLKRSEAVAIETQSNDPLLTPLLHVFGHDPNVESILFADRMTTSLPGSGMTVRRSTLDDSASISKNDLDDDGKWVVELDGKVVATGGILFHYNRPYGDIFMKVAESHRRRGIGSYLVQELKRVAYETGNIPAARCNKDNVASRKTLQRAGFVPCGNILAGTI